MRPRRAAARPSRGDRRSRKGGGPGLGVGAWAVNPRRADALGRWSKKAASRSYYIYVMLSKIIKRQPIAAASVAGLQALDQLAHRRHIAVGIKRVGGEAIAVVPGKHQLLLDIIRVTDRL